MAENGQPYLALYRKYRPQTFEDVRGRDAIVRTLKNQILSGRIGHSYLFCGTRGTGKTTIAKILARAVNCENPRDGSPCGECASCRAIAADASLNVVEMDAASNNSVDDIRGIIDAVSYSPTQGRFRVYIIDEVHMLSTAAFNALLKTLEEPPSYAIFILATTEPNKLPVTILSRCQRYDFGRLPVEVIEGRLREVAQSEQLQIEDRALRYIAGAADGSMRDGLSLLDQCCAFNFGTEVLTYDRTLEILGAVDTAVFSRLFRHIHEKQIAEALQILEEILTQGRELVQFITDYLVYLRNMMLLKASPRLGDSMDLSGDDLERLRDDAAVAELSEIMRSIRLFSALIDQIRYSENRRILTEMAIIRAAEGRMDDGAGETGEDLLDSLTNRVRELEQRLLADERRLAEQAGSVSFIAPQAGEMPGNSTAAGSAGPGTYPGGGDAAAGTGAAGQTEEAAAGTRPQKRLLPEAVPEDVEDIVRNWKQYIGQLPAGLTRVSLLNADLSLGDEGQLVIVFNNYVTADHFLHDERYRNRLEAWLAARSGKRVRIEYKALDKGQKFTDNYVDLRDVIRMKIDVE